MGERRQKAAVRKPRGSRRRRRWGPAGPLKLSPALPGAPSGGGGDGRGAGEKPTRGTAARAWVSQRCAPATASRARRNPSSGQNQRRAARPGKRSGRRRTRAQKKPGAKAFQRPGGPPKSPGRGARRARSRKADGQGGTRRGHALRSAQARRGSKADHPRREAAAAQGRGARQTGPASARGAAKRRTSGRAREPGGTAGARGGQRPNPPQRRAGPLRRSDRGAQPTGSATSAGRGVRKKRGRGIASGGKQPPRRTRKRPHTLWVWAEPMRQRGRGDPLLRILTGEIAKAGESPAGPLWRCSAGWAAAAIIEIIQ